MNKTSTVLTAVISLIGAGLGVWGVVNLIEGYGNDNPGANAHVRSRSKQPKTIDRPPALHYSEPKTKR
ncbi:Maff2 family mobile element protein [Bacteroides nordii]|uniref:Maff2 family mobile element protein n=1 Tax=Bacteroides nordii TaxID=291645 RepID=UPI003AF5B51A